MIPPKSISNAPSTPPIPQKLLALIWKVDECKPLVNGMCCSSGQGSYTATLVEPNGTRTQIAAGAQFLYQEKHDFALDVVLSPSPPPPPYPVGRFCSTLSNPR